MTPAACAEFSLVTVMTHKVQYEVVEAGGDEGFRFSQLFDRLGL